MLVQLSKSIGIKHFLFINYDVKQNKIVKHHNTKFEKRTNHFECC